MVLLRSIWYFGPNTKLNQNFLHVNQSSYQKAWEWKYIDVKKKIRNVSKLKYDTSSSTTQKTSPYCSHYTCAHMHEVQEYKRVWTFYKSVHKLERKREMHRPHNNLYVQTNHDLVKWTDSWNLFWGEKNNNLSLNQFCTKWECGSWPRQNGAAQ